MQGQDVICVLAFLSFILNDIYFPCALVCWFMHVVDASDDLTGMWVMWPHYNDDESPAVGVIHLNSILHSTHLIPVFRNAYLPPNLKFYNSLNPFGAFYVNKYIDYHTFEMAS